jgi:hypothetical protein
MRRVAKVAVPLVLLLSLMAAAAGVLLAGGILHPMKRELTPDLIQYADGVFVRVEATREDLGVAAGDGVRLRGWKVRPRVANGDWVVLYHGVSDNRVGMAAYAELLLRKGYSMVMMDARAHGASEGDRATYGWIERQDTLEVVKALLESETVHCLFLLGESMGASIALQSAEVVQRVDGVVAESAFASLREVSFDYAGLRISHWLGRTVFRPASWLALRGAAKEGDFRPQDVSPEKAVAARSFPVLLICGTRDRNIPPRHTKRIFGAAAGAKEMWLVQGARHTGALGTAPAEFERRVLAFYTRIHDSK